MEVTTYSPETCIHRWLLEEPNGKMAEGRCSKCGKIKEFKNTMSEEMWKEYAPHFRTEQHRKFDYAPINNW